MTSATPNLAVPRSLIGEAPCHLAAVERALRVAPTRVPVLVTGESGTGKELFARLLHERGPRPEGPLVAVNCGTLSSELAESELFGHERGAFTGAVGRRAGWFGEASGGTLVLDEIGELPLHLQPKLLRALETGCLRRVGGQGEVKTNVRIVALTLRDLKAEARAKRFRPDLYFRLTGMSIELPPLRQRRGDILPLARHFLAECARDFGAAELSPEAEGILFEHDWPGNVRQLRNTIQQAVLLSDGLVRATDLDLLSGEYEPSTLFGPDHAAEEGAATGNQHDEPRLREALTDAVSLPGKSFSELEREILIWGLRKNGGSRRKAARTLEISRSTFCDKVKRFKITEAEFRANV